MRREKTLVLQAVKENGLALEYGAKAFTKDTEIVRAALRSRPSAFQYVHETLRGNKSIVLPAVTKFGLNLQFVSEVLQDDDDVVLAAVRQSS